MITHKNIEIKNLNIDCKASKVQALEKILNNLLNDIHEIAKKYELEINIKNLTAYKGSHCFIEEVSLRDNKS